MWESFIPFAAYCLPVARYTRLSRGSPTYTDDYIPWLVRYSHPRVSPPDVPTSADSPRGPTLIIGLVASLSSHSVHLLSRMGPCPVKLRPWLHRPFVIGMLCEGYDLCLARHLYS